MKPTKLLICLSVLLLTAFLLGGCKHPLAKTTQGTLYELIFNAPGPGDFNITNIKGGILADDDQTIVEEITISSYDILRHQITLSEMPKWEVITLKIESEKPLNMVAMDIQTDRPKMFNLIRNGNLFENFSAVVASSDSGKMNVRFVSCNNDPVEIEPSTVMPPLAPFLPKTGTWFVRLPDGKTLTNNPQPLGKKPTTWGIIKKQP